MLCGYKKTGRPAHCFKIISNEDFTCNDVISVVYRWKSFHTRTSLSAKKVMNLVICGGKVHLLREK